MVLVFFFVSFLLSPHIHVHRCRRSRVLRGFSSEWRSLKVYMCVVFTHPHTRARCFISVYVSKAAAAISFNITLKNCRPNHHHHHRAQCSHYTLRTYIYVNARTRQKHRRGSDFFLIFFFCLPKNRKLYWNRLRAICRCPSNILYFIYQS